MMIAASRAVTQLVEGDAQSRQHAEREQIELHQARVRAVLLVPLEHGASSIAAHPTGQIRETG